MPVRMTDGAGLLAELSEQIGPRIATSAAEAIAAAQINARLRQVGFSVDTRSLSTVHRPGVRLVPVAILLMGAVMLAAWQPPMSLILSLWLMGLLLVDGLYAPLPVWQRRHTSQHIIAARPIVEATTQAPRLPRYRFVILAPLDTPPAWRGLSILIAPTRAGLLARLGISCLPVVVACATMVGSEWRWLLSAGAFGGSMSLLWAAWNQPPLAHPDGGLAALAALVRIGQQLPETHHVEVWAIAVGAAHCDPYGIPALLDRYPFDPTNTLVVGLGPLAGDQLIVISRSGLLHQEHADPLLYHLAMMADRNDPIIDLEPRTQARYDGILSPFRRRGFRTLSVQAVSQAQPVIEPTVIERAARLMIAIVKALDAERNDDLPVLRS